MPVCLVTAPTVAEFTDSAEIESESVRQAATQPQLGILNLAAVLEARGDTVRILDLNHTFFSHTKSASVPDGLEFAEFAASILTANEAEIYGFSSICSSYPLTLRIAQALKVLRPHCTILIGGPQASVVDLQTLAAFPFVDVVLRGEAEHTLPLLLAQLRGDGRFDQIPGLTYRVDGQPHRNPNAPLIDDLDALPFPAYHLTEYLKASDRAVLELGRGCPFACTFCSTNDFFRRKFRLRSPERVLCDMRRIAATYCIRKFELVHDMFTVDRKRVTAFCEAMLASGEGFSWSCSARTDCIDEELLALMARSGCKGIFYGVEVGSEKMQAVIDKHLDTQRVHEIIDATERLGIGSTVSLICGFPEETWDDVRQSMGVFMRSARCPSSHPQLNLLAPLAETPLYTRHKNDLVLEELCSSVSHQGRCQNGADLQLIVSYPDIFPNFYAIPTPSLERDSLFELREFSLMGVARFRWVLIAIDQNTSGILDFFWTWRKHRLRIRSNLGRSDLRQYYRADDFRADFASFVRKQKVGKTAAVEALLDYEGALRRESTPNIQAVPAGERLSPGTKFSSGDIPVRQNRTVVFELAHDIQRIVEALKLCTKPLRSRGPRFYVTRPVSATTHRVLCISEWMASLLNLCDGRRSIEEIVWQMSEQLPEVEKSLREYVCMRLLEGGQTEHFIDVYRVVRAREASARSGGGSRASTAA
jgi:radical SAM superfamily enzyme YgiQ (UPF0313 family)